VKRQLIIGALVVLGLGSVVLGRVVLSSRAAYQQGHAAEKRALSATDPAQRNLSLEAAIVGYRRAARWYAPGNGYVSRSLEALRRIARLAEKHGDRKTALMAYRAIRRAILGSRSFYTPHADHLRPANGHIARLSALEQGGKTAGADQLARYQTWHLAQLRRSTAPAVGWSILAVLGFFTWVAGAFLFIYRAITPTDKLINRQALLWGATILAGLILWLTGLSQA
jgi:hypothetical protein